MRERDGNKLYFREMLGGLAIYAALLVAALKFGPTLESSALRPVILASPMIGFFLILWAIIRHFRRMDEFLRRLLLENVAIAAAVTAGWTFTYGFLENADYPRLSMFIVMPVMGFTWGALACLRKVYKR